MKPVWAECALDEWMIEWMPLSQVNYGHLLVWSCLSGNSDFPKYQHSLLGGILERHK